MTKLATERLDQARRVISKIFTEVAVEPDRSGQKTLNVDRALLLTEHYMTVFSNLPTDNEEVMREIQTHIMSHL